MTTILFFTDVCYLGSLMFLYDTMFVILGFLQYIEVILCLSLLYLTAIKPIYKSYQPNRIIPFPLSQDLINELETALMMPTSSQTFYEFINDLGDIRGITLMALYADLRLFLNMVSDQAPDEELREQAMVIFKDYIIEGNTYEMEPNEITIELERGYSARHERINLPMTGETF
jgi:hypothetical protein